MLPPGESQPPQPTERAVVDLLGDLPTHVLDKILAGLPAGDVVRTSVLSTPWRCRWESVPGLDIELHDVRDEAGAWVSAASILERCGFPVGRVSIRGVPLSVYHRADDWVRAVAGKSPRSLSLALPLATPLPSLFRCDPAALAELELRCCVIPAPPRAAADGFVGFQRLTKLDLDDVVFTGRSGWAQLEAMVSAAAPTLVELRLQNIAFALAGDGFVPGRWVIQAPNLRRLVLCLRMAGAGLWELGPLPNLEFARIFLNDSAESRDYVQMFTAIANVRELHIGNFDMATQAAAINIFQDLLWRFENLRILRLDANFLVPPHHLFSLSRFLQTVEIKIK
ncbi:F-box/LRR-repeat protein At3g26922 isoform X2 [Sorghum bicolor]|uniref:F-box/LRR-repeat protein At3g26922 isoform X2 n=1 Tax=Sorghum bicolor TaxID=4558 RepID=UPI000B424FBC|nr:F-box/LRR-repeat protein At3g26922 isoform X2 [Sorghum bicolor]|eukprot:XP_021308565.1 F-box/LRR-repeat protein At3g26922 isoform X2 [Sorghum bicolor]